MSCWNNTSNNLPFGIWLTQYPESPVLSERSWSKYICVNTESKTPIAATNYKGGQTNNTTCVAGDVSSGPEASRQPTRFVWSLINVAWLPSATPAIKGSLQTSLDTHSTLLGCTCYVQSILMLSNVRARTCVVRCACVFVREICHCFCKVGWLSTLRSSGSRVFAKFRH